MRTAFVSLIALAGLATAAHAQPAPEAAAPGAAPAAAEPAPAAAPAPAAEEKTYVLPTTGVDNPIPAARNVAAYWGAIQKNEHAARTLEELYRGLEERRELIRSGAFEKMMAAAVAAQKAADQAAAN